MRDRFLTFLLLFLAIGRIALAQSVVSVEPRSIRPGKTTEVTVHGKGLQDFNRALFSVPAQVEIQSATAEKIVVSVNLPETTRLGPVGMWLVGKTQAFDPVVFLVEDLPVVVEQSNNHDQDSAQPIDAFSAVDGVSNGSKSDYFCFSVASGQRIAVEVLTQSLRSTMDPVVRLCNQTGETLRVIDDDEVGPECRFSHTFETAGKYWLEVRDNRYQSGGHYHLRIGDFPLVRHAFPLAVRRGVQTQVRFSTLDGTTAVAQDVLVPSGNRNSTLTLASRTETGASASWCRVALVDSQQHIETEMVSPPLALPTDLNGRLAKEGEQDEYVLKGVESETFRFTGRTRSLGSRSLLRMQLLNTAGAIVAQSPINDSDEWSFDFRFPDNGEYRLRVSDLLGRGGEGFGYLIRVLKSPGFRLAWKGDAKTKERFVMDRDHGACSIELQVQRFGYDGEIELSSAVPEVRILNPVIPAKAKTVKIFLAVGQSWTADSASLVRLSGAAKEDSSLWSPVTSVELHRLKRPHVVSPASWQDGVLMMSGGTPRDPYFRLEPVKPLHFVVGSQSRVADLKLTRTDDGFKGAVTLMPSLQSSTWKLANKAEKDLYKTTFLCSDSNDRPKTFTISAYSEFEGRGRVSSIDLPVQWIEPVKLEFESSQPIIAGRQAPLTAIVRRQGDDPQPAILKVTQYPDGWSGPQTVEIPVGATQVDLQVNVTKNGSAEKPFLYEIVGSYHGEAFRVSSQWLPPSVIALPERLVVTPSEIVLTPLDARRQLVVTGWDSNGVPRDWTREVLIESSDPGIVNLENSVVRAKANGETQVQIHLGEHSLSVPVSVQRMEAEKRVGFESEVLVALSKQGCNSGACHGSPSGKGMFRLSLRAFDKQLDELTLIREDFGRRINRIDPEQSLLLLKPLMKVNHGGGKKLRESDAAYAILRDWVAGGARPDPKNAARCVRLQVFPSEKRIMSLTGGGQQLAVIAEFSDGSQRDVTHLCAYESSETSVAEVDSQGWVRPKSRGEIVVLVRFLEHIESVPLLFIDTDPDFQFSAQAPRNFIDELVDGKLRQLQYLPSGKSTDAEFLRRVYLDVIGVLPTVHETTAFLEDSNSGKRAELIDDLLERPEFAKFWALKWGDLLRMTGKTVGNEGVHKYHRWVMEALGNNLPYDEFARALLAGEGSTLANPPANFYRAAADMNDCVETVSQVFLGARLQCAKCHNHPFERWTQDNYYGLAAFFNRLQRRKTGRPGETFVYTESEGEVTQPRTGRTMTPWLPVEGEVEVAAGQDRREVLIDWLVNPNNPYFARIEVNRIWSELFARGIVEPIDDFRDSNPPSNGPLLNALAKEFVEHGFDRKHLLRSILNSRTYQASCEVNDSNREDTDYFSHQRPRLLSAEQLFDAVNQMLGLNETFGDLPAGTRATHLPAPDLVAVDFLKVFGQPERSTVCACERVEDSNLAMAIELFNGSTIHKKLRDPNNRIRSAVSSGRPTKDIVRELYLAGLSRYPSELEIQVAVEHCGSRKEIALGLEDVCWALMNTDEFLFQH